MKTWIYSWLVYPALYAVAMVLGFFNTKVRETLRLRSWKDFLSLRFNVGQPIEYWIHVASHGELEYAIPILQELALRRKRVLITYYSISAKGPVESLPKSFSNVSLVVPLPHDGLGLMKEFVALVRKQGVHHLLLMKYELWPGLLWECNRQQIKVLLVDALKPSWFHRRLLHKLDGILSGYPGEVSSICHRNVKVVGDTRVERVVQRMEQGARRLDAVLKPSLKHALQSRPLLVCGSMWPRDTKLVIEGLKLLKQSSGEYFNLIWVPHELEHAEGKKTEAELGLMGYEVYAIDDAVSEGRGGQVLSDRHVAAIVMRKGILAELYGLGKAAFVGGGFGSGVHSVWEPALLGAGVACGPRTERSPEASELSNRNLLVRVESAKQFSGWLKSRLAEQRGAHPGESSAQAALSDLLPVHLGASHRIIDFCEQM